jgi:hypothetical protein
LLVGNIVRSGCHELACVLFGRRLFQGLDSGGACERIC